MPAKKNEKNRRRSRPARRSWRSRSRSRCAQQRAGPTAPRAAGRAATKTMSALPRAAGSGLPRGRKSQISTSAATAARASTGPIRSRSSSIAYPNPSVLRTPFCMHVHDSRRIDADADDHGDQRRHATRSHQLIVSVSSAQRSCAGPNQTRAAPSRGCSRPTARCR